MTEEQLKQSLKANLEIEIDKHTDYDGTLLTVKLKFDGETISESYVRIAD